MKTFAFRSINLHHDYDDNYDDAAANDDDDDDDDNADNAWDDDDDENPPFSISTGKNLRKASGLGDTIHGVGQKPEKNFIFSIDQCVA